MARITTVFLKRSEPLFDASVVHKVESTKPPKYLGGAHRTNNWQSESSLACEAAGDVRVET